MGTWPKLCRIWSARCCHDLRHPHHSRDYVHLPEHSPGAGPPGGEDGPNRPVGRGPETGPEFAPYLTPACRCRPFETVNRNSRRVGTDAPGIGELRTPCNTT